MPTVNGVVNPALNRPINVPRRILSDCVYAPDFSKRVPSGGIVQDLSGCGNNSIVIGNCLSVGDGIARFRIYSDEIKIPVVVANSSIDIGYPFSFSFYVRNLNSSPGGMGLLAYNRDTNTAGWRIFTTNGSIQFEIEGSPAKFCSNTNFVAGKWLHIAIVCNGTTLQFYTNSIPSQPIDISTNPLLSHAGYKMTIAMNNVAYDIALFNIFKNRCLTQNDVDYLYNEGLGLCQNPVPGNSILDYPCEETNTSGNGGNAIDFSGNIGNQMLWTNGPDATVKYPESGKVSFNGATEYGKVTLTSDTKAQLGQDQTLDLWLDYRAVTATNQTIFDCSTVSGTTGNGYKLYILNGKFYYEHYGYSGDTLMYQQSCDLPADSFNHVAVKISKINGVTLIANDVVVTTPAQAVTFFGGDPVPMTVPFSAPTRTNALFGCNQALGDFFGGLMSRIRFQLGIRDTSPWYNATKQFYPAPAATDSILKMTLDDAVAAGALIAKDKSGYNHDGAWNTSPSARTSWVAGDGQTYYAATFDGVDDCAMVQHVDALNLDSDFTISFWAKVSTSASTQFILNNRSDSDATVGWSVGATASNTITFVKNNNLISSYSNVNVYDAWHHIAIVRSGDTYSFYVDTVFKGSTTRSIAYVANTEPLRIGVRTGNYYSGNLRQLTIDPVALTAEQVKARYNADCEKYRLEQVA